MSDNKVTMTNKSEVIKLNDMLADIEPILNKYGFTWATVMANNNCNIGHYNIHISPLAENKQTCDNCGQDHKYCEPTNKEQFGFCGNWAEHQ